jgi:hypothetical protein
MESKIEVFVNGVWTETSPYDPTRRDIFNDMIWRWIRPVDQNFGSRIHQP